MHSIKELMKIYGKLETAVEEITSFVVMSKHIRDVHSLCLLTLMDTPVTGRPNTLSNIQIGLEVAVIASTSIPVDVLSLPFVSKLSFGRIFNSKPANQYLLVSFSLKLTY